ncbi:MAG: hypothetical protein KDD66_00605 [Bdellovibrionales bacterium]|nr:hypothetical protein [Bdellovibrionales bacterium]
MAGYARASQQLIEKMKVGILFNPASGKGHSPHVARELESFLSARGVTCRLLESSNTYDDSLLDYIRDLDVLIVAGGDGTLLPLLDPLAATKTPVYMLPTGNESLFAREFSMTADFESVFKALQANQVTTHHIGEINGTPFFTMASVGFDSCVIQEIASKRVGPIGHIGYIAPSLKVLKSYKAPRLTISVDGKQVVDDREGFFVVSNNKQYALKMFFNRDAVSTDEVLDATFLPCKSFMSYFSWQLRHLMGSVNGSSSAVKCKGTNFKINSNEPYPVQIDGEYFGSTPVQVAISSNTIQVLEPT